jgi:cadmium resistance protein CadD (predicted permease)
MSWLISTCFVAIAVFVSTNIDDILLLSAFFSDRHLRGRSIVVGQFLGIGTLFIISAVAALAAFVIPSGWTGLLGFFPFVLGLRALVRWWTEPESTDGSTAQQSEQRAESRFHSQALGVTAVTLANGGDNLGVYIPLFTTDAKAIPVFAAVFAMMTAIWCYLGYVLVSNRLLGDHIRRIGRNALPFVLIALGLHILYSARVLLDQVVAR